MGVVAYRFSPLLVLAVALPLGPRTQPRARTHLISQAPLAGDLGALSGKFRRHRLKGFPGRRSVEPGGAGACIARFS